MPLSTICSQYVQKVSLIFSDHQRVIFLTKFEILYDLIFTRLPSKLQKATPFRFSVFYFLFAPVIFGTHYIKYKLGISVRMRTILIFVISNVIIVYKTLFIFHGLLEYTTTNIFIGIIGIFDKNTQQLTQRFFSLFMVLTIIKMF